MMIFSSYIDSPLGSIELRYSDNALLWSGFVEGQLKAAESDHPIFRLVQEQFEAYFEGKLKEFSIPLQAEGTEFQQRVWKELLNIPYGTTNTYLGMAKLLGDAKVIRAAGTANGKNPIGIIIPCHRVIGSDGSLTGYAGGLWRKKWLLELEAKYSGKAHQGNLFG